MIKSIKLQDLRRMDNKEGLILQGCGGSLQEWVDGINEMLTEDKILLNGTKFTDAMTFEKDNLTCLLFPFGDDVELDMGKLAMWRLRTHQTFGGTWLSDYVDNNLGGFLPNNKLSFFCPLSGQLETEKYDYTEEPESVSDAFILTNAWEISQKMKQEQSGYNIADYHPKELREKIESVVWDVEEMHDHLVGRIDCTITGELRDEEIAQLKDWIVGQNADGFGEGFEQRPIKTDEGNLYIHLWQWDGDNEPLSAKEMEEYLEKNEDIGMEGL